MSVPVCEMSTESDSLSETSSLQFDDAASANEENVLIESPYWLGGVIPFPCNDMANAHVPSPLLPANIQCHLSVLRRFCSLYNAVEQSAASLSLSKSEALTRFLISAEARYIQYLSLLDNWLSTEKELISPDTTFIDEIPLPPWYPITLDNC